MQVNTLITNDTLKKISIDLYEKRLSVVDNFLCPKLYKNLCREARRQHLEGLTRPAKIGRMTSSRKNTKIRGDKIRWVTPDNTPKNIHGVFHLLEDLRVHLKQSLFLPLHDTEHHLAVYPSGAYYRKHLDCHKGLNNRVITFILYLNRKNWSQANGGQLRIWHEKNDTEDFLPVGNRLVIFSSSDFYHAVLPALANRYSFTGWFRRQEVLF